MLNQWMQIVTHFKSCLLMLPIFNTQNDDVNTHKDQNLYFSLIIVLRKTFSWFESSNSEFIHSYNATLTMNCFKLHFCSFINNVNLSRELQNQIKSFDVNNRKRFDFKKQPFDKLLRQISHIMSDVVIFNVETLEDAAKKTMKWVSNCYKLKRLDKPFAFVLVFKIMKINDIEIKFNIACLKTQKMDHESGCTLKNVFKSHVILETKSEQNQRKMIMKY